MNVYENLEKSLRSASGKAALISGVGKSRRQLTFGELEREVDDLAQLFRARGLRPGDKVLVAIAVSVETFITMLAILKAGLVVMFIDPGHGAAAVARCLRLHPPSAIVGTRAMLLLRFLWPEIRRIRVRIVAGTQSGNNTAPQQAETRSREDSALLTFTSGSTGEPKAVMRTHGFLRQQLEILNRIAAPQPGDIDFAAMPMFVLFNLAHATTSVLPACDMKRPGQADPRVLVAQLKAEKATTVVASPALLGRLANYCLSKGKTLPALRSISTGGGPVSPTVPERLIAIAPNAQIRSVYGSTEAEPIASVVDDEISIADKRAMRVGAGLLVGRPVSGCDTRIIPSHAGLSPGPFSDAEFDALTLADGEIGEIVVSGGHVLSGYADPARNRETKIDVGRRRWHRTGDAGYFDAKGRLWLVGRCAAAIQDARGVVYPFQVEFAVSAVRGINRAALISDQGKRVLVVETSGREFSSDCIKAAHCIVDKRIDKIIAVRRIPMDRRHDAKVDYPALKRLLEGRVAQLQLFFVATSTCLYRQIRNRIKAAQMHMHAK